MPRTLKELDPCPWCKRRPTDLTARPHGFGKTVTAFHQCNLGTYMEFVWAGKPEQWKKAIKEHKALMVEVNKRARQKVHCPTCNHLMGKGCEQARKELNGELGTTYFSEEK